MRKKKGDTRKRGKLLEMEETDSEGKGGRRKSQKKGREEESRKIKHTWPLAVSRC